MNFYLNWEKSLYNIEENKKYTKLFLSRDDNSLKIFKEGTKDELVAVCKFLLKIPINNFIYCIDEDKTCTPDMIVQFSNLEHAIVDVSRVLKFNTKPLTFSELGEIIIKAKKETACKKYGENHAKLAKELSMVNLERQSAFIVSNTSFGDFSVGLSDEDRNELAKRLILRNEFIQKLIYLAKKELVSYMDIATEIISESTAQRRKSNIRKIVNLILTDNELAKNIIW